MIKLTLKEVLQDALVAEKFMMAMYEQYMKESSNTALIDVCLENFAELSDTLYAIFIEMKDRGMYPVENAEKQKIEQTITMLKESTKAYTKDFN